MLARMLDVKQLVRAVLRKNSFLLRSFILFSGLFFNLLGKKESGEKKRAGRKIDQVLTSSGDGTLPPPY